MVHFLATSPPAPLSNMLGLQLFFQPPSKNSYSATFFAPTRLDQALPSAVLI